MDLEFSGKEPFLKGSFWPLYCSRMLEEMEREGVKLRNTSLLKKSGSKDCRDELKWSKFGNNNNYMNMAEANNAFLAANEQTFHTPSLGDEEFEIPPITPPPESDPALGMADILLPFQGLGDQLSAQGNEFTPQFPPQSLDLPSITISRNLVEQDGIIHSNGLHM
ncbi:PREDICTED: TOX high mobility group box family member 3-like, partial [Merops nubicus]|uniref:TOX high mobility group box family member 3-like n=1 Tax=Merops nubicus TaxID=57421 RepID=UPI0004F02111